MYLTVLFWSVHLKLFRSKENKTDIWLDQQYLIPVK